MTLLSSAGTCLAVLTVFALMRRLSARLGHPAWANPVLAAALTVIGVLAATGVPIATFQRLAAPLGWALGPAIVALAAVADVVRPLLAGRARPALIAILGGTIFGLGIAWGMARLLGLDPLLITALATKTISSPFLITILGRLNAPVALPAALSVATGVIAAMLAPPLFNRLGLRDRDARALALGVSGHLVGSEYAIRQDPQRGGLAIMALVTAGLTAAVLLPLVWQMLAG
ncbi:LrgB family protein [Polymorphobacter sp.]|uniref:LrgB family protein n=1 Tax=Polymorphobacter sp. TaxID=1909290 RepID=UPI003F72A540